MGPDSQREIVSPGGATPNEGDARASCRVGEYPACSRCGLRAPGSVEHRQAPREPSYVAAGRVPPSPQRPWNAARGSCQVTAAEPTLRSVLARPHLTRTRGTSRRNATAVGIIASMEYCEKRIRGRECSGLTSWGATRKRKRPWSTRGRMPGDCRVGDRGWHPAVL